MPFEISWKNTTIGYVAQNTPLATSRVRSTNRSTASAPAAPSTAAAV
jgi:hypothetical protein